MTTLLVLGGIGLLAYAKGPALLSAVQTLHNGTSGTVTSGLPGGSYASIAGYGGLGGYVPQPGQGAPISQLQACSPGSWLDVKTGLPMTMQQIRTTVLAVPGYSGDANYSDSQMVQAYASATGRQLIGC